MLRTLLRTLLALTLLLALPTPAHAVGPAPGLAAQDTQLVITSTDTVPPKADSVAQGIVLPKGCSGLGCAKAFVVTNQLWCAMGLTSIILFGLANLWTGFATMSNKVTIAVQLAVGFVISYAVTSWGGSPDAAINAMISSGMSALLGGTIFRFGKTQPGNGMRLAR